MKPFVGKMAKVIRQEAAAHKLIEGTLIGNPEDRRFQQPKGCKGVGHCALGALAFAAGVSNQRLMYMGGTPSSFPSIVHRKLWETYRIDADDMDIIMGANDGVHYSLTFTDKERIRVIKERRDAVLKAIEKIGKNKRRREPKRRGVPCPLR